MASRRHDAGRGPVAGCGIVPDRSCPLPEKSRWAALRKAANTPFAFALTTEAGLNDGLAFPFVHLGIVIATAGTITADLITEWAMRDLVYRVLVGAVGGAATGWPLLGQGSVRLAKGKCTGDDPGQVWSLLLVSSLLTAFTELIEGYGFIAAFVAGLALRRQETEERISISGLHDFSESPPNIP